MKPNPFAKLPNVIHEISVRNGYCCELKLPADLFQHPDVGLHVVFNKFEGDDRVEYKNWFYIKDIPVMQLVSTASLACNDLSYASMRKIVVNHILRDEMLISRCSKFLEQIDSEDNIEQLEYNPHGPNIAESYNCFEFYLPGCTYGRPDVILQITYREKGAKVKYNVWCHLDHFPLLGYIGHGKLHISNNDVIQGIVSQINGNDDILQKIAEFIEVVETI